MAKKTWIKVKRGILEPRHIDKLGAAWYLYFYILDNADWDTGRIANWKDKYAADELCKPLGLIREHRKKLQDEGYIECEKNRYSQTIVIKNWTNPRMYDGSVINEGDKSNEKSEGTNESSGQSNAQSSGQSSGQSAGSQEENLHSSYNHIPHTTSHNSFNEKSFVSVFLDTLQISIQTDLERGQLQDLLNGVDEEKLLKIAKWYTELPDRSYVARRVLGSIQSAAETWVDIPVKHQNEGLAWLESELAKSEEVTNG